MRAVLGTLVLVMLFGIVVPGEPVLFPCAPIELRWLAETGPEDVITAVARPSITDPLRSGAPILMRTLDRNAQIVRAAEPWSPETLWTSGNLDTNSLAVSWDGFHIVFAARKEGASRLYLLAHGSEEPVQLTDGPGNDREPTISPSKAVIAFLNDLTGVWKLHTLKIEAFPRLDQFPFPLTLWESLLGVDAAAAQVAVPGASEERSPCFGPRGLVFLSNLLGTWDLWILEGADYSSLRRVISDVDPETPVAWVGDRVFVLRDGLPGLLTLDGRFFQPVESEIKEWWRLPGAPRFVCLEGAVWQVEFPDTPEPDFAFFRGEDKGRDPVVELWLGTLDAGSWRIATDVCPGEVSWSPTGNQLVYLRRRPRVAPLPSPEGGYSPDWYEVWAAKGEGTEPYLIRVFDPATPPWIPSELRWSPDGAWIYLSVAGSATHREIWRMRPDGSELACVTWGWDYQIGPDGSLAGITRGETAFYLDRVLDAKRYLDGISPVSRIEFDPTFRWAVVLQRSDLRFLDVETGTHTFVASLAGGPGSAHRRYCVSWSPQGGAFAFGAHTTSGDAVFVYNVTTGATSQVMTGGMPAVLPSWGPGGNLACLVDHCGALEAWVGRGVWESEEAWHAVVRDVFSHAVVWRPARP